MLNLDNNIDETFRNGLNNLEAKPSDSVWKGIDSALNNKGKKRSLIVIWGMVGAASVLAIVITSILFLQPNAGHDISTSIVEVEKDNVYQQEVNSIKEKSIIASKVDVAESSGKLDATNTQVVEGPEGNIIAHNVLIDKEEQAENSHSILNKENEQKLALMKGKGITSLNGVSDVSANKLQNSNPKEYYPLYVYDDNSESKDDFQVLLGGALSSAYNYRQTSGAPVRSYDNYSESGFNSIGGGINVRIETSKRWSVETGIVYAQLGQEISRVANYQNDMMYSNAYIRPSMEMPRTYNNSLGKIQFDNATNAPKIGLDYESTNSIYDASMISESDGIRQSLEYIEVPLMARYKLIDGFPIVSLAGGMSSNILVGNTAYLLDGNSKLEVGRTEDIKPVSWSSSIGLGLELPVTKMIRISVEPRFKYYLESISENPDYSFQPYAFSVFGGITFVLK